MKENAVIFYFRIGVDAFSQKIERSLYFFSDSFVLYSGLRSFRYKVVSIQVVSIQMYMIQCSCHVLLAEFAPR